MQRAVEQVRVDDSLRDYALEIVERTRQTEQLTAGREPARLADAAARGAGARLPRRPRLLPADDFKQLVLPVFAHRVVVNTRYATTQKKSAQAEAILSRNRGIHARPALMACHLVTSRRTRRAGAQSGSSAREPTSRIGLDARSWRSFVIAMVALGAGAVSGAVFRRGRRRRAHLPSPRISALAALALAGWVGAHDRAGAGAAHAAALARLPDRLQRDARRHRVPRRHFRRRARRAQHRQQSCCSWCWPACWPES